MRFLLKPSSIHGVGVFTLDPIFGGTFLLDLFDTDEKIGGNWGPLAERFGFVALDHGEHKGSPLHLCPMNFNRMSIGWYLNSSDTPNAKYEFNGDCYYAIRDIDADEEITINYE